MELNTWYELDPDNNKKDPKSGLFCCRCKRKIKETQCFEYFISVKMHPIWGNWVMKDPLGNHLLGSECARKINKIPLEMIEKHG